MCDDWPQELFGSRARRFDLHLPVSYRIGNEETWRSGTTQSISMTGAIITARESVVPADTVDVAIALPSVPGCLVGRGRIVRTMPSITQSGEITFAIAVDGYRINHRDVVLNAPASSDIEGLVPSEVDRP
jgi:PilZ domain-containing protein